MLNSIPRQKVLPFQGATVRLRRSSQFPTQRKWTSENINNQQSLARITGADKANPQIGIERAERYIGRSASRHCAQIARHATFSGSFGPFNSASGSDESFRRYLRRRTFARVALKFRRSWFRFRGRRPKSHARSMKSGGLRAEVLSTLFAIDNCVFGVHEIVRSKSICASRSEQP